MLSPAAEAVMRLLVLFVPKYFYSFGKRQISGHASKIAERLVGRHADVFDHQNLSRDSQVHRRNVPASVAQVGLLYQELSAFVEPTEDSPSERHLAKQLAIDSCNPLRRAIDQ